MTRVYLSLGSNLGDRLCNLRAALEALQHLATVVAISSVYDTEPVGMTDQPGFLNIAVSADVKQTPHVLLRLIKKIEEDVGRRPTYRWGPRVIDLDILLYGDRVIESPDLVIPHPEMAGRAFVLVPLAEIAPGAIHPVLHAPISA